MGRGAGGRGRFSPPFSKARAGLGSARRLSPPPAAAPQPRRRRQHHPDSLGRAGNTHDTLRGRAITIIGTPLAGSEIKGVEAAASASDVVVTHAGTRADGARLLAAGGRVLNVTALASSVAEATTLVRPISI